MAAASRSSGAWTERTKPIRSASTAVSRRPVKSMSRAIDAPTPRTSRAISLLVMTIPSVAAGIENQARSEAILMSQAAATSVPAPTAAPLTTATTGFGHASIDAMTDSTPSNDARTAAGSAPLNCSRSAPALNTRSPVDVTRTTRTESSLAHRLMRPVISAHIGADQACLRSGRSMVTRATPSWRVRLSSDIRTPRCWTLRRAGLPSR